MCGIAGFFNPAGFNVADTEAIAVNMRDRLVHRGPDDAGTWLDGGPGIAMVHRRLSILDISSAGHQPMLSDCGRYVLVFNGEIYNHMEIRCKLEVAGYSAWRGHSDTETLLAAIKLWGLELALKKSVGMFALALWDRQERNLSLARDRMGEKPLYYGWQNGILLFGSELKALQAHPAFSKQINRDILPIYLRHGYIPAPFCVWRGVCKLLPGTMVNFTSELRGALPSPVPYWSLIQVIEQGQADPFVGSDVEAIDLLEQQLKQSVAGQQLADVPLGAFLSGGVDSSTVVALMQTQSSRPVKTFTIGFHENGYNEAKHAQSVAKHLGADHTELYLSAEQAQAVIPELTKMYDEPFGDSSAIPTHLVSHLARQQVTVSLSGDGGDELFGGYRRYFNRKAELIWNITQLIPHFLRKPTASVLRSSHLPFSDQLLNYSSFGKSIAAKCVLMANVMECSSYNAFYRTMTSQWQQSPAITPLGKFMPYGFSEQDLACLDNSVERMMAMDSTIYLPDDILTKVDRAAMSVSLETRIPLLDYRVVELAWRLPYELKVRGDQGKWLLRKVLYRYVPQELIERPKMGFGVPVDAWLRDSLRVWAEELLSENRLNAEGFFDPQLIRARWQQHLNGQHNWRDSLWALLMWQVWLAENSV